MLGGWRRCSGARVRWETTGKGASMIYEIQCVHFSRSVSLYSDPPARTPPLRCPSMLLILHSQSELRIQNVSSCWKARSSGLNVIIMPRTSMAVSPSSLIQVRSSTYSPPPSRDHVSGLSPPVTWNGQSDPTKGSIGRSSLIPAGKPAWSTAGFPSRFM